MQSSVRSNPPPRLGDLPRIFLNDSVHISKEVSITSSRAPTPPVQRYSRLPPAHIQRPQSIPSSLQFGSSTVQVARWSTLSKGSEKPSIYERAGMGRRPRSVDHDLLKSNRESMKELSEFLMTREPPPTSWVSNQSSDDEKSLGSFRRSAYKLFGKSKKKKRKILKLMRLPDSAVAARTIEGTRYIAISIPLVYDHVDSTRPLSPTSTKPKELQRERVDRATIHVLKPLHEGKESVSNCFASPSGSSNAPAAIGDEIKELEINPLAINPPDEALRQSPTLGESKSTYPSYRPQARIEPSNAPKHDPKTIQKCYVAVSPTAIQRQDSQRSDPRHSGGTVYSTISIATPQAGHSRRPSSVSTAPSATATHATVLTAPKLNLPLRNSSMSKMPKSIPAERALTLMNAEEKTEEKEKLSLPSSPNPPIKFGNESIATTNSPNSSLLIVGSTAETVRKYNGAGLDRPTLARNIPRPQHQASPPPNRSLPDLPIRALAHKSTSRPRTAPPFQTLSKEPSTKRTPSNGVQDKANRLSRQERVREKKQRDIEALRSSCSSPLSESNINQDSNTATATTIGRSRTTTLKRNGISGVEKRRLANSITPLMVIANLPPIPSLLPHTNSLQYKNQISLGAIRALPSNSNISEIEKEREKLALDQEIQSRPHSPSTPLPSDFPSIPTHHSNRDSLPTFPTHQHQHPNPTSSSPFLPISNHSLISFPPSSSQQEQQNSSNPNQPTPLLNPPTTTLSTHRLQRREKRNAYLREKELDARLRKLERENAVLLETLSNIAKGLGALSILGGGEGVE